MRNVRSFITFPSTPSAVIRDALSTMEPMAARTSSSSGASNPLARSRTRRSMSSAAPHAPTSAATATR